MRRFNGPCHKGYMKTVRAEKRLEAEERNAFTSTRRTRVFREGAAPRAK
ncbi:hypothetical protein AB0F17_08810 [Nonomuraea sp. NPDC026600]